MEKEGIFCITVFRFQPEPGYTRPYSQHNRGGVRSVMEYTHTHTHHVAMLHATTATRGQVREEGVRGRKQTTKGGATKGIFVLGHRAGKTRQGMCAQGRTYLYCCHSPCASIAPSRRLVFSSGSVDAYVTNPRVKMKVARRPFLLTCFDL